ncbi:hypothetical protein [Microvirga sp. Mcv34]|uniref:hypothetical protein n=1 Tax=Microvirga sp. Mcv34 TaxID=2926016 RepID=UPI0021C95BEC|nr:hypothetical protein [Microvirga sp. Mcv34]
MKIVAMIILALVALLPSPTRAESKIQQGHRLWEMKENIKKALYASKAAPKVVKATFQYITIRNGCHRMALPPGKALAMKLNDDPSDIQSAQCCDSLNSAYLSLVATAPAPFLSALPGYNAATPNYENLQSLISIGKDILEDQLLDTEAVAELGGSFWSAMIFSCKKPLLEGAKD